MICAIDPSDTNNFKELDEMNLGTNTEKFVNKSSMSDDEKIDSYQTCQDFLIEICLQMQKRFNLDDERLIHMKCFHPKNAMSLTFHTEEYPNLYDAFPSFSCMIDEDNYDLKNKINEEWMNVHIRIFK